MRDKKDGWLQRCTVHTKFERIENGGHVVHAMTEIGYGNAKRDFVKEHWFREDPLRAHRLATILSLEEAIKVLRAEDDEYCKARYAPVGQYEQDAMVLTWLRSTSVSDIRTYVNKAVHRFYDNHAFLLFLDTWANRAAMNARLGLGEYLNRVPGVGKVTIGVLRLAYALKRVDETRST